MGAPPIQHREGITIRSYRVVFRLERRLHRIDRWRLPVPYGVPLRGLAYTLAILAAIVLAGRLPVVGELIALLPAPLRYVLLPAGLGFFLARAEHEGRPAHAYLLARARWRLGPRTVSAFRPIAAAGTTDRIVEPITFEPDEHTPTYRRATVRGPGRVVLAYPVTGNERGSRLELTQTGDQPLRRRKQLLLKPGQEVTFK